MQDGEQEKKKQIKIKHSYLEINQTDQLLAALGVLVVNTAFFRRRRLLLGDCGRL